MVKLLIKPTSTELIIKHPATGSEYFDTADGDKIQCILTVVGSSSKEFHDAIVDMPPYAALTDSTEGDKVIAALIVGWKDNGFIDTPYSKDAALELIENPENLWLKAQIKAFVENNKNFFVSGAKD